MNLNFELIFYNLFKLFNFFIMNLNFELIFYNLFKLNNYYKSLK